MPHKPYHTQFDDDPSQNLDTSDIDEGKLIAEESRFLDIEKAGITAKTNLGNALPSLPSISNVGSVPFTGTVSNIPGGFQPLPQTAGQRKKLYQLSKFHGGINLQSSPRDISDMECQSAKNVTFSEIGRITLLGDCLNEDNTIKEFASISATGRSAIPGYGLFEFTAPADWDAGNVGQYQILLTTDGDQIDALDHEGGHVNWIDFAGTGDTDTDVAPVFYAAGNGVYVDDANFTNANDRKAKVYVYREDAGSNTVSGWVAGEPLIDSPTYDSDDLTNMVAGTARCNTTGGDASGDISMNESGGSVVVKCDPAGAGSWDGDYFFYISWLFDGGCETGLTSFAEDSNPVADDQTSTGITFDDNRLIFNLSILHANGTPLGGDKRIEGARIYFKKSGTAEKFLLAEFNMIDGVKGALDSTFIPWDEPTADTFDLALNMYFDNPPEVYSYSSLNGYYANEVYTESSDVMTSTYAGPKAHDLRYKTAVVGSGGIVFIGNVKFKGKHMSDSMMFSVQGKPGVFPQYNRFDSPSSDGSPITALAAYRDTILQFKENGLYVINVSNPAQFYAQSAFRDCGVHNPCQVFTTSFGVIFVNKNGCYIYDGQKVTSLTAGKFDWTGGSTKMDGGDLGTIKSIVEVGDTASSPSIGYDPRSQNIVVLVRIGDDQDNALAWVYNLTTQSWSQGASSITNADGTRHTNFIITSDGYLSMKMNTDATLLNYNHDKSVDTGVQTIQYRTKDLDFGLPSQTKKLFKVYVTFKGNPANINVSWGKDGAALVNGDSGGSGSVDLPYDFSASGWSDSSTLSVATFTPDNTSEAIDWKSMCLSFTSGTDTVASTFEINDISILYRARPIK